MLGMVDKFVPRSAQHGMGVTAPNVAQTLSVKELVGSVPQHDGWIIGEDPASREAFIAGKGGRLKAAVKWDIGVDNVDFEARKEPVFQSPTSPIRLVPKWQTLP